MADGRDSRNQGARAAGQRPRVGPSGAEGSITARKLQPPPLPPPPASVPVPLTPLSSLTTHLCPAQSAGATSVPDLSGHGLTGLLPNGGTFNNDFLYLNSANNQWVNISSGIKPYLNTQDYSIMGCVVSKNPAAWARFFDFVRGMCAGAGVVPEHTGGP